MIHEISVLGCGVIYIDNERVFGSKPYGLFSTVNWSATDEDLKRVADRCLELIADRKDELTCDTCRHKGVEGCEQPCLGCGRCGLYEAITGNDKLKEKVVEFIKSCARCKHRPIGAIMCDESCHYEPKQTEPQNNCKYLINTSGDVWECGCCLEIYCDYQIYDRNPDGTLNIVKCGFKPKTPTYGVEQK